MGLSSLRTGGRGLGEETVGEAGRGAEDSSAVFTSSINVLAFNKILFFGFI